MLPPSVDGVHHGIRVRVKIDGGELPLTLRWWGAPKVWYSVRILYQGLNAQHGFRGSYETVKHFVSPPREISAKEALTQTRLETAPGAQNHVPGSVPTIQHCI